MNSLQKLVGDVAVVAVVASSSSALCVCSPLWSKE